MSIVDFVWLQCDGIFFTRMAERDGKRCFHLNKANIHTFSFCCLENICGSLCPAFTQILFEESTFPFIRNHAGAERARVCVCVFENHLILLHRLSCGI